MFFNFSLFHIIFIISVLRVDVLLGQQDNEAQSGETGVGTQKSRSFRNRIRDRYQERFPKRTTKIHFGGRRVKKFDENEPPNKVGKKNRKWIPTPLKWKQKDPKYKGLKIERYLKRFSLSSKIWHHVWKNCKRIECYSQNHYARLYGKFLDEMNLYRRVHGSRPLVLDGRLTGLAMERAKVSAKLGKSISSKNLDFGENSAICSVLYAPLTVNNWYEEGSKYNYKTFVALPNIMHFSNLIWKNTRKVGIGIVQRTGFLYIHFLFWPPGNQNIKFGQNVMKPKYHWYNYRGLFKA